MTTRTYQPRTSAQFQTISDLKNLSNGLDIQTQKVEEKLVEIKDSEELLELLKSKSADLASLTLELEQLRNIQASTTVQGMLKLKPLLDNLVAQQPLLCQLSESSPYLPKVAHSIDLLEHIEKFIPHLELLDRSLEALAELNRRVDERKSASIFRRFWNNLLEKLKFTPI